MVMEMEDKRVEYVELTAPNDLDSEAESWQQGNHHGADPP